MPPSQSRRKRSQRASALQNVSVQAVAGERGPHNGLEIDDDRRFEARDLIAQRIGWVVVAALVIAAMLGAFGGRVLSRSKASAGDTLWVEYERFARQGAPTTVVVHVVRGEPPIRIRLERREQITFAVLERSGGISIVPAR